MKPIDVRLQNAENHTGITKEPVIAWKYGPHEGSSRQTACRIRIYEKCYRTEDGIEDGMEQTICVYDSGILNTDRQNNHRCCCRLKSHTKYEVRAEARDERNIWEKSGECTFFSGVVSEEEWSGRWISSCMNSPQYLGKDLELQEKPVQAVLSCAGVGQYELRINGNKPDESVLNGSWTDFHKHIHYQTYDITDLLKKGGNTVIFEVGNGWYSADTRDPRHFYTAHMGYQAYGKYPAAAAVLTMLYEDGRRETVGTDGTWWSAESETIYTNIYGSEDYDARRTGMKKASAVVLDRDTCPQGKLVPMLYPPVKIKNVYQGVLIKQLESGGLLFDVGQNMSGLFEVQLCGKRGTRLKMLAVEKLDAKGNPWRTTDAWCTYTLSGAGKESWMPKFTYQAGRYLELTVDEESEVKEMPEILEVSGHFVTTSAKETGKFFCSDYRCMQIHDLVLRAVESNLHHVHTDCPTIERLGWQEPNHLMAPSIFYCKNVDTLWSKIAMDERDSQYGEDETDVDTGAFPHRYSSGLLTAVAPRYARFLNDGGEGSFWDIVPWGSSILMAAYEQYRFTGNKETLFANYKAAQKYIDYLYQKYLDYPVIYQKEADVHFLCHGLGDWGIEQNRGESRENIETAYLYRDLILLSQTARWMKKGDEARHYEEIAASVLEEYNRILLKWNPQTGEWAYGSYEKTGRTPTQAVQAIPLQFKMVPEEKKESVQKSFLMLCEEHKIHSGEIGLPYILRTLTDLRRSDLVLDMIMQKTHPSYYRFVEQGETTLPEFWRDDSRSRNHDMMGPVLEWFYRGLAGISSEDGYRTIRIAPDMPEGMDYVKCSFEAVTGTVDVTVWRSLAGGLEIKAYIPVNTKGSVQIGTEETKIQGGCVCHIRQGQG